MRKILIFLGYATAGFCEELSKEPQLDVAKISEAMGHLIGKNLQDLGLGIDISAVVKGLEDAAAGLNSPISEDQCVQQIAALQEEHLSSSSKANLEEAEAFLQKNGAEEGVVSLENGKLQYRVMNPGKGQSVQPYNSPLVRYTARYLNGPTFGVNEGDEVISLDEVIPGFSKGVIGMQEGEIRTLFVHPDLGYGKRERIHPSSLLIFEVELVKADASAEAHAASNSDSLPGRSDKFLTDGEVPNIE